MGRTRIGVAALAAALAVTGAAARADADWVIKLGAQYEVLPDLPQADAWAFAFNSIYEYNFAGPVWFEMGSGLAVNGTYFDWHVVEAGLVGKFPIGKIVPTFRAAFIFDWRQFFEDESGRDVSNFILGASFGPGVRFLFGDSGRAILIELGFIGGKLMRDPKDAYFAILPQVGFDF
ncbi:MAG: hypothetical protein FJ087_11265 [Deltaproteobacteria bacterium]|nr:hypothetical protein [Deltaproteobacteria bacterium]